MLNYYSFIIYCGNCGPLKTMQVVIIVTAIITVTANNNNPEI